MFSVILTYLECNSFYKVFSLTHLDVDECSSSVLNGCEVTGSCTNTDGSYTCACEAGYTIAADGRLCEGKTNFVRFGVYFDKNILILVIQ